MNKPKILLAIKNDNLHEQVRGLLLHQGIETWKVSTFITILELIRNTHPNLLVLESPWDDNTDILKIAEQIREADRRFPIILVTTQGSKDLAITAFRVGIKDYFESPLVSHEFIAAIKRYIYNDRSQYSPLTSKPLVASYTDSQQFIGESFSIRKVKAYLKKVAVVDSHVLITGETGTGKELTAHFIHSQGMRNNKPFIAINCAALPDGLLESELFGYEKGAFTGAHSSYSGKLRSANGGTVFFDEIGDMSPFVQAKILRVIESKEIYPLGANRSIPINIRIIAATNRDLEHMVSKKEFRQDLYFRLNIARVKLPPLRERKEDIVNLINHYIQDFNVHFRQKVPGFTDEAMELLLCYSWPGNIRELKNLIESIFINPSSDLIAVDDLPDSIRKPRKLIKNLPVFERELLLSTLNSVDWNKSKAAEQLHWSRMTLYRKMAKHHIVDTEEEFLYDHSIGQKL